MFLGSLKCGFQDTYGNKAQLEKEQNQTNIIDSPSSLFLESYRAMWTGSMVENVELMHQYMANSLSRESLEMNAIRQAVRDAGLFIVLGYSERDGGSLYMAQSFINPDGQIVHHRRKIKPTHVERSIWGEGQAESLQTVVDSPFGRIGALNCWEHLQPLLRFYEYSQRVQVHVASWPPEFPEPKGAKWPYHETDVASRNASQFLAIEGQAFVLVCTQVVSSESLQRQNLVDGGVIQTVSDHHQFPLSFMFAFLFESFLFFFFFF